VITETIIVAMARTLFVSAWSSREEEAKRTYPGHELMDVAPKTPPEVVLEAYRLAGHIEAANGMALICLFCKAYNADHPGCHEEAWLSADDDYLRSYGHYLAMGCLGEGASWEDDHIEYGVKLPHWEYHLDPLETA
jgi:hypothetical protein